MAEFVICISNQGYTASLIVGKVYRCLADPKAEAHQMLRILDEDLTEPEGYLYPASLFVALDLPERAKQALRSLHG